MKLLFDMNLSPGWVDCVSQRGIKAVHWLSIGSPTASDAEIMAFAKLHDFVVVTHDLDFGTILAATRFNKPSVVIIRAQNIAPELIGGRVIAALRQAGPELDAGALLVIDPGRARLRILPLT
jgi:predicted nuclease of predicted toxin-antitoxin system